MPVRTSNLVLTYTLQIMMARDIPYRTDKAIFQHHGMDSMSQTVFPSISIKTMIIFVHKSQEKHLVKTPSSSQKL